MPAPPSVDLGLSASSASASSLDVAAGTVFNFAPNGQGDTYGFSTNQTPTATATTAQKSPGSNSPITPTPQTGIPTNFAPVNGNPYFLPIIGASVGVLLLLLLLNKK
jgi:hypothetical protein